MVVADFMGDQYDLDSKVNVSDVCCILHVGISFWTNAYLLPVDIRCFLLEASSQRLWATPLYPTRMYVSSHRHAFDLLVIASDCVFRLQVVLSVEEITRDKKVLALKFRRRKNSRRRKGHRRDLTVLRVVDIVPSTEDLAALVPSK